MYHRNYVNDLHKFAIPHTIKNASGSTAFTVCPPHQLGGTPCIYGHDLRSDKECTLSLYCNEIEIGAINLRPGVNVPPVPYQYIGACGYSIYGKIDNDAVVNGTFFYGLEDFVQVASTPPYMDTALKPVAIYSARDFDGLRDGEEIHFWNDSTGNDRHLSTQNLFSHGGDAPKKITIHGKPAVEFANGGKFLSYRAPELQPLVNECASGFVVVGGGPQGVSEYPSRVLSWFNNSNSNVDIEMITRWHTEPGKKFYKWGNSSCVNYSEDNGDADPAAWRREVVYFTMRHGFVYISVNGDYGERAHKAKTDNTNLWDSICLAANMYLGWDEVYDWSHKSANLYLQSVILYDGDAKSTDISLHGEITNYLKNGGI